MSIRRPVNDRWSRTTIATLPLPQDCNLACSVRVNLFVLGEAAETRRLVDTLHPYFEPAVVTVRAGRSLPPLDGARTLILDDVNLLPPADQHEVETWLDRNAGKVQVISASAQPILPMIATGTFLESLYYRLNTVYCEVAPSRRQACSP
jgi:Sigma-54 interaction domain